MPLKRRSSPQTRGVDSAELAQLPRLPDTADELRSIALALEADPSKALYLGKAANEKQRESDRPVALQGRRLRHPRAPDLNGLTQPDEARLPTVPGQKTDRRSDDDRPSKISLFTPNQGKTERHRKQNGNDTKYNRRPDPRSG